MLQEPLLVVAAFYILFFTVIIYVRLDFAITKVRRVSAGLVFSSDSPPFGRYSASFQLPSVLNTKPYLNLSFFLAQDPAAEVRMKVASITEQVLTLVNKRLGLFRHMDEVVNRYKQSRDTGALNSGRKTLEADHRALTVEITSLQARLKAEGSDLAEKVSDPVFESVG